MLHVTNTTMKKTTLIITTVALFMLVSAGCEETNTASRENNNNDVVAQEVEKISFNPPKTLIEVVEGLDSNSSIIQLSSVEPSGSTMKVALTRSYSDVEGILLEYNQARDEQLKLTQDSNARDLGHFSNSKLEGADKMVNALLAEKENIETALAIEMDGTLLISEITVMKQ